MRFLQQDFSEFAYLHIQILGFAPQVYSGMWNNVTDSCDMFHSGDVIHEYADAAYSVRSGDKIVSKKIANETTDRERRDYVFHVP